MVLPSVLYIATNLLTVARRGPVLDKKHVNVVDMKINIIGARLPNTRITAFDNCIA